MDSEALDNLCELARIRMDYAERQAFAAKFTGLLQFVERILEYEPQSLEPPLASGERLELRQDSPQEFVWDRQCKHSYTVPRVINFEGDS